MPTAILTTKLYIPPRRPNWVIRARLLQKMTDSLRLGCKLTLISAPAGFGKTTLVTEWIETLTASAGSTPPAVTWLSLDESDNHLTSFLSYLIAALERHRPGSGEITRHLLEHVPLPAMDALLLPLLNNLAARPDPLVLVLDDYHSLGLPAIHEAVAFLIEHQPPAMQVVITTRQDPLLPLARWRARGLLTEIRLKELRFTGEEAAEFLNHTMGLGLRPEDINALEGRTEGWIAGLQLAAVSMRQSDQDCEERTPAEFVHDFTGNDRYVMDYLIEEVLCRQPDSVQRFLLRTSVLERFSAGLCAAVLDDEGTAADGESPEDVIKYLDRANLFLIPLDNHREWYRYHHLFAELLQHRLKISQGSATVLDLKRRAIRWLDEHDLPDEAIRYALSSADWALSSQLISKHGPVLMQNNESAALLRWMAGLPEHVIRASDRLCFIYGSINTITGKLDLGEQYLRIAEHSFQDNPEALGSTLAYASFNACFRGDFEREIELARQALDMLPLDSLWIRGVAAISLGLGLCHIGDPKGCEAAMHEALEAGQTSNIGRTCVQALTYLGRMAVQRLDFNQAEIYFQQASQYLINGRPYPSNDMALFDLAQLKYEQNALDASLALVQQGLEVNQRSSSIEMRAYGFRLAARLNQLQGRTEAAYKNLDKALKLAVDYNLSPLTLSLNAAMQIEMALTDNRQHVAELAAPHLVKTTGVYSFMFFPEMARVHLLLVQGQKAAAMKLLETALPIAEQLGWEYPRLQVRLLQALGETNPEMARKHLREALALAEPAGALRSFLDLGAPLLALLRDLRPHIKPSDSAFADQLLAAFSAETVQPSLPINSGRAAPGAETHEARQANGLLVEPLSERELEVLRLLADGLSNAEIAQRLYLSPNTLKAHTQNIYTKMDVHSRVQVINKARELGLIR